MTYFKKTLIALITLLLTSFFAASVYASEKIWVLETSKGTVTIELLPHLAPKHVERIQTLTKQDFYDGVVFHRVIDGFMAQGGDPTGTGTGGSDLPNLSAEFSNTPFERGVLGMARSALPNSANSQFFIMYDRNQGLDGQYTVFGRVVSGMEAVDALNKGSGSMGLVQNPDKIIKAYLMK